MRRGWAMRILPWLAPWVLAGAVLAGVALVRAGQLSWFGVVLGLLAVVPAGWVLVSALWPARAERRCPACGAEALARRSPDATHGLVCRACGWSDESASAWLLAEEEGELEPLVLAMRASPRPPPASRPVDSPPARG